MVMNAVFSPYWDGDRHVVSCDERVADSDPVAYGQGSGAGEIAAWLEGDFGCLGRGSEQRTRGSFDAVASDAKGGSCVHHGEGHVVHCERDLFLVFSRWNRGSVALRHLRAADGSVLFDGADADGGRLAEACFTRRLRRWAC